MGIDVIIGLAISGLIAILAYLKKSLTKDGLFMAVLFGMLIYVFGGILVWASLIAFFISSSLLTKLHEKKDQSSSKGRNYIQVISNGLVATIFSIIYYVTALEIFLIAAIVSIATSNSDTWASEIGILSKGKTRYILNFKLAPKGVSGAISSLGTFASLIGAFFIAIVFTVLASLTQTFEVNTLLYYGMIITIGGFLGCFIDSYLGGLLQAKYKGVVSGKITEKKWLPDEKVVLASGIALITNDAVNFLSGLFSSILTVLLFAL